MKQLASTFIGTAFAAALAGNAIAADKIIVGLTPSITNAAIYAAEAEGFFDKHDLDVEFVPGGGSVLVSGVISGSMTISEPTVTTILQGIDSGLEYKVISGINVPAKTHQEYTVVISKASGIKDAGDFSGKTVAVSTINALLHVMFMNYLKENGVDPSAVRFVEVPFPQMADVMSQGTIDAAVPVQPFSTRMIDAGLGDNGPDFVNSLPEGMPLVAFIATDTFIAENPDIIKRFKAALAEGVAFAESNPEKTIEDSNIFLKMPPEVIAQVKLPSYQLDIDPAKVDKWVDIMDGMGLLQNDISASDVLMQE